MIAAHDEAGRRMATVDTGGPDDVFPGRLMLWIHRPRGGYGYGVAVPAVVLSHAARPGTWVVIEVARRDGSKVKRRVDVASLRSAK